MTEAYPLQWPLGKPRAPYPKRSQFKAGTFGKARDELFAELRRLNARSVVLSTNVALRQDGLPYSGRTPPSDKGIAVYFEMKGRSMCFACDKWDRIEDNVRAITRTIEAIRGIERWGGGDMVEQAFTGFTALPAPSKSKTWYDVMGCSPHSATDSVKTLYRDLARECHPDNGGDGEAMAQLNAAWASFKMERGL